MNDGFFHYQLSLYEKMNVLASLFVDPENPDDFIAGFAVIGFLLVVAGGQAECQRSTQQGSENQG